MRCQMCYRNHGVIVVTVTNETKTVYCDRCQEIMDKLKLNQVSSRCLLTTENLEV